MNVDENGFLGRVIELVLALAFGAWAWVVKVAASAHLKGVGRIEDNVDRLGERVSKLEGAHDSENHRWGDHK